LTPSLLQYTVGLTKPYFYFNTYNPIKPNTAYFSNCLFPRCEILERKKHWKLVGTGLEFLRLNNFINNHYHINLESSCGFKKDRDKTQTILGKKILQYTFAIYIYLKTPTTQ